MRKEDQERILTDVESRTVQTVVAASRRGGPRLDEVVADTIYHELRRVAEEKDPKIKLRDRPFYDEIRRGIPRASERALQSLLEQVVRRYASEIKGNFDERVYKAVTRAGEPALGLLLNAVSPKILLERFPDVPRFDDAIVIQGEIERLRRLHELGTVILVPTHVSNMDSIVVGYVLYKMGLPPFIYGAGLNLFSNPLIGFFMHNLGAYTVDRRKTDPLYKTTLKNYAQLTLEHGYDNIFFPGGTRSRSGAIETKLKLGLLGTGVGAYTENLIRKKPGPRVFIVPATLSYQLVLEAETLIDDFLKEVGKSRYIITDDEFAKPKRVFDFLMQNLSLDSKIVFTVGRAFDPFGNDVDEDGESIDPHGRRIDPSLFVLKDGVPVHDDQRDEEFTREVGVRISDAFLKDNVIQATNVTARALFDLLRRLNPETDIVRLLRTGAAIEDVELLALYDEAERLLRDLRGLASRGGIRLSALVEKGSADDVVSEGLRGFSLYHTRAAATRRGDRVFATDKQILFYYQNRLEGYRLERAAGLKPALTADHRNIRGLAKGAA
jgi:glycerol-3-phosphate O-acyltransferase